MLVTFDPNVTNIPAPHSDALLSGGPDKLINSIKNFNKTKEEHSLDDPWKIKTGNKEHLHPFVKIPVLFNLLVPSTFSPFRTSSEAFEEGCKPKGRRLQTLAL